MLFNAALLSLAVPALAAVHESLDALPYGWKESSTQVSDDAPIALKVSLAYQNLDKLESTLAGVSTPGSKKYGKYLDVGDIQNAFGASATSKANVKTWLQRAGMNIVSDEGDVIGFTTTVGKANSLLNTKFAIYTDGETQKLRTTAYSVPDALGKHIDLISPTTYFGGPASQHYRSRLPLLPSSTTNEGPTKRQLQTSCETVVPYLNYGNFTLLGPDCFKELYSTVGYQADPKSGSTIAFGNFLNESASYSDLQLFEQAFNIPEQNFTVKALINGGVDNQNPLTESDGEANLDVQNIIGIVDGLPVWAYITGGSPPYIPDLLGPTQADNQNEPYLEYYQYLLSQPNSNLPLVISNSYGDHEDTVPERYARRVCNQIGMMGMRGITIFESSGDEGVGAVCRSNRAPYPAQFTPQFPGTCPYITAVGGTVEFNPEQAWDGSSGGFSFYFKRPWYQEFAVNTYLNKYIDPAAKTYYAENNYTDFHGRGFPDVAAHSLTPYYLTYINGTATPNGGTSAASPITAGVFALLNDARLRAGLPSIGFANPWLYLFASNALNDITLGASAGCQGVDLQTGQNVTGAGIIPYASWNATIGWDPVTGLGTPNFVKLKESALGVFGWTSIPSWFPAPSGGWGWGQGQGWSW